jgi:hypothetical protein
MIVSVVHLLLISVANITVGSEISEHKLNLETVLDSLIPLFL